MLGEVADAEISGAIADSGHWRNATGKEFGERAFAVAIGAEQTDAIVCVETQVKVVQDWIAGDIANGGFLEWLDAAWRGRNQAVTMQALMGAAENDQAFGRKLSADEVAELREVASRTVRAMTAFAVATRGDSKAAREMRAAMGALLRSSSEAALVDAVARRVLIRDAVYGGMHYVR